MALKLYDGICVELPDKKLETLQAAVSGYIEIVPVPTDAIIAYANEEGAYRQDFKRNNAGELLLSYFGYRVTLMGLLGPIAIVGKKERPLTASAKGTLKAMYELILDSEDPYEGADAEKLKTMAALIAKPAPAEKKKKAKKTKQKKASSKADASDKGDDRATEPSPKKAKK